MKKMLMWAEFVGCVTWFICFLDLLYVRYNCAQFYHCRICVTEFRERAILRPPSPIREQPQKVPFWIGAKKQDITKYHNETFQNKRHQTKRCYSGHKNVVNFYMQKGAYPKSGTRDLGLLVESETWDPGTILWVRPETWDSEDRTQDSRTVTQLIGGSHNPKIWELKGGT